MVSIPYKRVTNAGHFRDEYVDFMFQSPISGSQTTETLKTFTESYMFQSPISGSQTRGWIGKHSGHFQVSIPYKRVTNTGFFRIIGSPFMFQSPISGSQTYNQCSSKWVCFGFQSPISGSQTMRKGNLSREEAMFQSPISGSQTGNVASTPIFLVGFNPL